MQFRSIEYASPEYEAACALRHTFLRVPLGLERRITAPLWALYQRESFGRAINRLAHWQTVAPNRRPNGAGTPGRGARRLAR